jgi:hypothetical protein
MGRQIIPVEKPFGIAIAIGRYPLVCDTDCDSDPVSETWKEVLRRLSEVGFPGLTPDEHRTVVEGNRDLFEVPMQVANPTTGIVRERLVIDWKNLDMDNVERVLRKNKRI